MAQILSPGVKPTQWRVRKHRVVDAWKPFHDGLVSCLPIWEGGGTRLVDYGIERSNAVTVTAGWQWIDTSRGPALDNQGIDGGVITTASRHTMVAGSSVYTFSIAFIWNAAKPLSSSNFENELIGLRDSADSDGMGLAIEGTDNGAEPFVFTYGGNTIGSGSISLVQGNFHVVVAEWNQAAQTIKIWVDGVLDTDVSSYTDTSATTDEPIRISDLQEDNRGTDMTVLAVYVHKDRPGLADHYAGKLYRDPFGPVRPASPTVFRVPAAAPAGTEFPFRRYYQSGVI